jgi:hypothetical protein
MQNEAVGLASRPQGTPAGAQAGATETIERSSQALAPLPQTPRSSYVSPGQVSSATGSASTPGRQAPGWYADPFGSHEHRYRDVSGWTRHVADAGIMGIDLSTSPFVLFGSDE